MKNLINVVRRIVYSRIRHMDWRDDTVQDAMVGILRAAKVRGEISEHLAARIAINACHTTCRKHIKDPAQLEEVMLEAIMVIPDVELMMDVMTYIESQNPMRRRILEYLMSGGPFDDYEDMAGRLGTSKATISRTVNDAVAYVKGQDGEPCNQRGLYGNQVH